MSDAARHMDAIYRLQRHIYDITRKPYLLGRDVMIRDLQVPPGGTVLEIGCGTARNLLCIARRYPQARCFGVDISSVMLETANASIRREGAQDKVRVALADATGFDAQALFGVARFDRVVISYALSMIPDWEGALERATALVAPGGALHIADFGDQADLPGWFKSGLFAWLRMFSVEPRLNLGTRAAAIAGAAGQDCRFRQIYGGYAALVALHAPAEPLAQAH